MFCYDIIYLCLFNILNLPGSVDTKFFFKKNIVMAKFDVTGEQHFSITGQMLEIQRQLRLKSGSPLDPEKLKIALQNIIENKFAEEVKKSGERRLRIISQTSHAKLISENTEIILDAIDGSRFISEAESTFKRIDSDFENWGLNKKGKKTTKTSVGIYELVREGTFKQMFKSFNTNLDKLVLTQSQIIEFCEKYPSWLRQNGYSTFFLIKKNKEYFVVSVYVLSDGLIVGVDRFGDDGVWDAEFQRRVVVPQFLES